VKKCVKEEIGFWVDFAKEADSVASFNLRYELALNAAERAFLRAQISNKEFSRLHLAFRAFQKKFEMVVEEREMRDCESLSQRMERYDE
jgi:hypothetical protein